MRRISLHRRLGDTTRRNGFEPGGRAAVGLLHAILATAAAEQEENSYYDQGYAGYAADDAACDGACVVGGPFRRGAGVGTCWRGVVWLGGCCWGGG